MFIKRTILGLIYASLYFQVRSKTAFYLACIMEESTQVQRALTDLCLAAHLVAVMRFHHDEASENVAR